MSEYDDGFRCDLRAGSDTARCDFLYPRSNRVQFIEVGLEDVRAADSIRIHYDFTRDGYVIEQASKFIWNADEETDNDWQEVAFVGAWAREETAEQTFARTGHRK